MAQPSYTSTSIAELARLVDEIWFLAGDTSVDTSWYTKRASLSAIYSASEIFMTQDRSLGFADQIVPASGRSPECLLHPSVSSYRCGGGNVVSPSTGMVSADPRSWNPGNITPTIEESGRTIIPYSRYSLSAPPRAITPPQLIIYYFCLGFDDHHSQWGSPAMIRI